VPTIRALRDHAERLRRHELEKAMKALAHGEDLQQVLESMSQALTNKLLHGPSHALNNVSGDEREQLESLLRQLYQIRNS
jgi:glutamyl-tRNA reductase